jgi:hypothetical protein
VFFPGFSSENTPFQPSRPSSEVTSSGEASRIAPPPPPGGQKQNLCVP